MLRLKSAAWCSRCCCDATAVRNVAPCRSLGPAGAGLVQAASVVQTMALSMSHALVENIESQEQCVPFPLLDAPL